MTRLTDYEKFRISQSRPKIIWLYGQPGHGKTTLAKKLETYFKVFKIPCLHIDGDDLRSLTNNVSYDRQGRENNINNAMLISKFLMNKGYTVVVSLVTPYRQQRESFASENDVKMIHLYKTGVGERDQFKVPDFEGPSEGDMVLSTTHNSVEECVEMILDFVLHDRR